MFKKTILILIVVLLIALVVGGYLGWKEWERYKTQKLLNDMGDAAENLTEDATKGVLPSIGANPLENRPDVNPVDQTNPFTNIKTNPF